MSDRLRLREFRADDLDLLAAMVGDDEQMTFYPRPKTRDEAAAWIRLNTDLYATRGFGTWLIEALPGARFAGYCGIRPLELDDASEIEIGWHVHKHFWKQGIATAAAALACDAAATRFGLDRLVALVHPDHTASRRVAENIGMRRERTTVLEPDYPAIVYAADLRRVSSSPSTLDFYDSELRAHHEHLRAAHGIGPGEEVVDIGCGTGLTTREAARAAAPGRVVGVDVSERMIERARQLAAAERLVNVRYELGDAQVHRFDRAGFDVAISRFGTMFFSDPAAAFANIAAALRPQARLVLLVWQPHQHNEWARAIDAALGDAALAPRPGADPFSLGDAQATAGILQGAGFDGTHFEDVHEPVFYGHDLDAALALVRGFQDTRAALASMTDDEAARTVERLREMLAAHYSQERGVALDSRSWLITARRRR